MLVGPDAAERLRRNARTGAAERPGGGVIE